MALTFNLFRVFLSASAIAALVASGVLLFLGDVRGAVAAAVVAASALIMSTARTTFRSPRLTWLGLGLLGSGLLILGFQIGTVVSWLAGLFVLQLIANAFFARRIGRITFERLDESFVMPGAEALVQEFSEEGFRVIGGYGCHISGKRVLLTVMIGPDRDRLVVVTDRVWYVVSRFGARTLVSGTSGVAPVPPALLRQVITGGRPAELVRAHEAAMTIVSGHSLRPDVFDTDDEALDAVRMHEERAIAFIGQASLRSAVRMETARPVGLLLSDPDHHNRVEAWIRA